MKGRVQGVGFRWFVREAAAEHGVTGWVRNRPDGAVEAEAEGEDAALDAFTAAVRRGPPASRVQSMDIKRVAPSGGAGFDIR